MPGDINSYALGIEFNLTATKALDTLQTIGDQVMKIQKAFESPINVTVQQSTELKANVAITENAAEINDRLMLGYENQARSLQDYTTILQQTTKTQDEYDRVMIRHGDTIKDAAKEHEKLEKILGYEDETVIKLGEIHILRPETRHLVCLAAGVGARVADDVIDERNMFLRRSGAGAKEKHRLLF